MRRGASLIALGMLAAGCSGPWNDPYPASERGANILYASFSERPKHLDPARSYSSNEIEFTAQIYEPPLQYHFLKRPYTLVPLTATAMPKVTYLDVRGRALPATAAVKDIAFSVYEIRIRPGIRYQPHPAFAQDDGGRYVYHALTAAEVADKRRLSDFPRTGSRELTAADYVYEVKRLANPRLNSPIFGLMSEYIVGLGDLGKRLDAAAKKQTQGYLDLDAFPLEGVQAIDRYTYRIRIRGKYPQFAYWLAMPFFAPVPWEVEKFFSQPGMKEKNFTLDWQPVGTGPYLLSVNDPNRVMVLSRNPNFHGETYPTEGEPDDADAGLLADAGKSLPIVDKVVFTLEKETIPYWNKFLQGYYDASGISSDSFDQAIRVEANNEATLTDTMRAKDIHLVTAVQTSDWYLGFNWLDPVVGGDRERARKLRLAISIAMDWEEFISIFLNGRGIPGQGPLPPGIYGYRGGAAGANPYVYRVEGERVKRRDLAEAKRLLAEAGYPEGRDAVTGKPLVLYFDTTAIGPDAKSRLDWMVKQFAKIGIQLVARGTDYNRFQEKMLKGNAQIFEWGWNADYPDPENFLFLLYGPNRKAAKNGENAANYENSRFDALFERMKNMDNGPERQKIIDDMVEILRHDAPWIFAYHPKQFSLHHGWVKNVKPHHMANNTTKYRRVDPALREARRAEWNRPVLWLIGLGVAVLAIAVAPAVVAWRKREARAA